MMYHIELEELDFPPGTGIEVSPFVKNNFMTGETIQNLRMKNESKGSIDREGSAKKVMEGSFMDKNQDLLKSNTGIVPPHILERIKKENAKKESSEKILGMPKKVVVIGMLSIILVGISSLAISKIN